jgi:uncharacterized protein (TIGR02300 family)
VAKAEWGTKRQCPKCGARFYDLNVTPIVCIACATSFEPESVLKSKQSAGHAEIAAAKHKADVKKAAELEEAFLEEDLDIEDLDEEADEDDVLVEVDDLEDDDVAGVIDAPKGGKEDI